MVNSIQLKDMNNLWTPWRMEHVTGSAHVEEGCLFEPKGSAKYDKSRLLLYRDEHCVILLNRFPYTNGHLLVAPKTHVGCLTELNEQEAAKLMDMVQKSCAILKKTFSPDGINIGCNIGEDAGAGIADHLHFHLVPRWRGDNNFMTVLAEIRTIPEHIEKTFDRLLPEFQSI